MLEACDLSLGKRLRGVSLAVAAGQVTASQSREITTVTAASPERVRITRWVATSPPSASRSST